MPGETSFVAQQIDAEYKLCHGAYGVRDQVNAEDNIGVHIELGGELLHAEHHARDNEREDGKRDEGADNQQDAVDFKRKGEFLAVGRAIGRLRGRNV